MAFSGTPKFHELQTAIGQTELALNHCKNPDYIPQKQRSYVWSLADMGDHFYMLDLYSEALSYYVQAKKIDCDEPSVLNQIGVCLTFLGKIERALYYFELLERRAGTPENKALALSNCAYCHELLNDINAAVVALRKSIKHVPAQDAITKLDALKELNSRRALRNCMQSIFSKPVLPRKEEAVVQDLDSTKTNGNGFKG
jgi:tetratricopeptide (TPR) repeat protein